MFIDNFKLELKNYDTDTITKIFERAYGKKLKIAYSKSIFSDDEALQVSDFNAGYHTKTYVGYRAARELFGGFSHAC